MHWSNELKNQCENKNWRVIWMNKQMKKLRAVKHVNDK